MTITIFMGMEGKLDSRYLPLVLDVVSQGVFTVDRRGRITSFNRAAHEITGYEEPEVLGRPCREIFRTDLCSDDCPLMSSIASGHEVRRARVTIHHKRGHPVPIEIGTAPLVTPTGTLLGGVEVMRDLSQVVDLQKRLEDTYRFDDIISKNPAMQALFEVLPRAAESDSTLLISGDSGTGKELLARAIHTHSRRREGPFVAVNCAAVPETLLESELFGYRKGAFTGASMDKPGRIEQARGGTLMLDEVGDMPLVLQAKILRFLQSREYEPLGATETLQADVRVIAATHRRLETLISRGAFREDLYYRLNVLELHLPPLRERAEDIPLLVRHFIRRFRHLSGKPIHDIDPAALGQLMRYSFPGNVRELENIIERAFILCRGETISVGELPESVMGLDTGGAAPDEEGTDALAQSERDLIRRALRRNGGNRTHAAKELGIHRSTLVRKLKRLGIV